jgi:hypothetical protein
MQESGIHLPIDIRGQIDRGVAQLALDVGERFALLHHEARVGMPEAMGRKWSGSLLPPALVAHCPQAHSYFIQSNLLP